ncbi:MAG: DNA primase [Fibrobacterota bacterium]
MKIPDNILEQIKNSADIGALASRYVELRPAGANLKGLCPFHKEKTPSFTVSPGKGIYKCFGCGKAGDIFGFIREIEGVGFPEAVRICASFANVDISEYENSGGWQNEDRKTDIFYKINDYAADFFCKKLLSAEGKPVQDYLIGRGITRKTVEKFKIGFAPDSWNSLLNYLNKAGFREKDIFEAGLLSEKNGRFFDRFRTRLMFPIRNQSGLVLAFGGRNLKKGGVPKYLNTNETAVYVKGKHLYGLCESRDFIRREDACVLVEGYMDYHICYQGGLKNICAALGTALTPSQSALIRRYAKNAVTLYDGDPAGLKAAERAFETLLPAGLNTEAVILPPGEDPDSFMRHSGEEGIREFMKKNKIDFVDFILTASNTGPSSSPHEKQKAAEKITRLLSGLTNDIIRDEYLKKAAERLSLKEEHLQGLLKKNRTPARERITEEVKVNEADLKPEEKALIMLLLRYPDKINEIENALGEKQIISGHTSGIYFHIKNGGKPEGILDSLENEQLKNTVSGIIINAEDGDENFEKDLSEIKKRFKERKRKKDLEELLIKYRNASNETEREKIRLKFNRISLEET